MIQFHLDEHLSPAIARALSRMEIDVSTSQDAALLGDTDHNQLAFATSQRRAFVTCDDDFLREGVVETALYGICYCHPGKHSIGEMITAIRLVADCMTEEEMANHVEWL